MARKPTTRGRPFIHLRSHSAYSILEGAIQIGKLKDLCVRAAMPAIALTDTNNMFGALEFSEVMAKAGVQPIVGLTLAVHLGNAAVGNVAEPDGNLVFLASTEQGYLNLMQLASKVWLDKDPVALPFLDLDTILSLSEGLILLTGGPDGCVNRLIAADQIPQATDLLTQLRDCFGDRMYVELQRHGLENELKAETVLIDWAYGANVGLVATQQPFFEGPEHYQAHDALLCISASTYLSVTERRKVTPRHCFLRSEEMRTLFADLPEAIDNTIEIAKRCSYRPHTRDPILPRYASTKGLSEAEELAEQARAGLKKRLQSVELAAPEQEYLDRLDFELQVIEQMGFPGYFLIVADFIKWSNEQGIPVGPGRGSGAGSVVAWALTITGLDPIRFGLLFERFLNPERVSMPDFDIDFCQDRRGEVIEYVRKKYGADRVAQIITFGTLQPRAALRDVGRVMQLPLGQVDRLAKMVPNNPADPVSLTEAIKQEPRLQEARDADEDVATLLRTANQLEGLTRNASTHAAGVVISDRPLVELTPLYLDPRSEIAATQFNMKWVEKAGLVKFDFLGLKTLTVIDRALRFIAQRDIHIDIDTLPLDDEATYAMLREAETVGVFQLESAGMRDTLRKAGPDCFEDIIAIIALYRPGPMDNIPKYVACKFNREKPIHLHEMISPLVADTYGIIIYQEQVMQIAQVLSGYSLGEADLLRRAMGKKIKSEMAAQRVRFVDGAVKNGVDKKRADEIFDIVNKFAGYGFNKSHSAAYAMVAYQTAWLKAHYPVEFLAASMSLDNANTDKLAIFSQDAKRLGIKVIPPDINASLADFSIKNGCIRYALGAIRNVGQQAMQHVVQIRESGGAFTDLYDFADRIDPSCVGRRSIENLARADAFRSIEANGRNALEASNLLQAASVSSAQSKSANQASLFGEETTNFGRPPLPDITPWTNAEKMNQELASIGFFLSGHPLDDQLQQIARLNIMFSAKVQQLSVGGRTDFRMIGVVRKRQERISTRNGRRFAYVLFSDPEGEFEVLASSQILDQYRDDLEPGSIRVLRIKTENKSGDLRMFLDGVDTMDNLASVRLDGLCVNINSGETALEIREHLQALPTTENQTLGDLVLVAPLVDGRRVKMNMGGRWPIGVSSQSILRGISGVQSVTEIEKVH